MQRPGLGIYDWWASHPSAFDLLMKTILAGVETPLRTLAATRLAVDSDDFVLDLGCGTGPNLPYLRRELGSSGGIVALDFSSRMLQTARERAASPADGASVGFVRGDARQLGLASESVDGILATLVLSALPDYERVVTESHRVLRPGGRFVVLDGRPFQHGPARGLNPLIVRILRRLTNWYPSAAILQQLRATFEEVTVDSFAAGALYLVTAQKQPD